MAPDNEAQDIAKAIMQKAELSVSQVKNELREAEGELSAPASDHVMSPEREVDDEVAEDIHQDCQERAQWYADRYASVKRELIDMTFRLGEAQAALPRRGIKRSRRPETEMVDMTI
ncbi:hypothetical protein VTJ49DRAFT_3598 [Mycothermus thermophilus]|uniref:Uncharacterized protein n=1 Tax=Humicola insolens TaxID=85995 RepID=A0ABR3VMV6_HUMIN